MPQVTVSEIERGKVWAFASEDYRERYSQDNYYVSADVCSDASCQNVLARAQHFS